MSTKTIKPIDLFAPGPEPWPTRIHGMYYPGRARVHCGPTGVDGEPVKRTKMSHPYSYDPFVLVRFGPNIDGQTGVYTDRMESWDRAAWNRAIAAIKGRGRFSDISPEAWRRFFNAYYPGNKHRLVAVEESCNLATGYPVWCIIFAPQE